MKDSATRRAWVKNVAIIFLVILLLLTFFSRTILNYSLPEVSAQYAQYATLTTAVKTQGTVKANESYNVVFEESEADGGTVQSRKVVSVYVKEGDTVEKDAPILALSGGPSTQLDTARKDYEEKKKAYELALLDSGIDDMNSEKSVTDKKREIEKAEDKLAELKDEYKAVSTGGDPATAIKNAVKALKERIKSYETEIKNKDNQIKNINKQITALAKDIAAAEVKLSDAKAKRDAAQGMVEEDLLSPLTVSQKLAAAESEYAIAETEYNEKKAESDRLKEIVAAISASHGDVTKANELTNQIKTLEDQLEAADKEARRAEEDYYDTLAEYEKTRDKALEDAYKTYREADTAAHEAATSTETDEEGNSTVVFDEAAYQKAAARLQETYDETVENTWDTYYEQAEALAKTYNRAKEDREASMQTLDRQIADAQAKLYVIDMPEVDDVINYEFGYDLGEAQSALEKADTALTAATEVYEKAKTNVESLRKQSQAEGTAAQYQVDVNTYQAQLDALNNTQAAYEKQIEDIESSKDRINDQIADINDQITEKNEELADVPAKRDPEEVEKDIKAQEDTVRELKEEFEILEASEGRKNTESDQKLEAQKKEIEELEKKIKEYENAPENTQVLAPIAGRVVSVSFVPGDTVTSGNTVASIEIADKGYVVEISMPAEEARRIQVGSPCTVTNSWWYSNITASVAQVRSDPKSQGKNRIIVINVSGDVSEGQSLNFSIGDRSQSYDSVLPNSAIREDNDGKFVLTVEAKKTPLGNRYVAKRTNVEILASDDTQSAVSGLYGSEFVITSSTTPITDGQQVRLAGD